MGLIYAEIELINGDDMALVRKHYIVEKDIKRMHVNMLVGTGAYHLCINESIQKQLQFPIVEKRKMKMNDGKIVEMDVVDNVEIRFENRATTCRAMVLLGDSEPLLGTIPMLSLDKNPTTSS
jgi:clan AA aspartic protease